MDETKKLFFKGSPGAANSFSSFWPAENVTSSGREMIQWVEWLFEFILQLLAVSKCYLGEVERAKFKVSNGATNSLPGF
jgi:hypothetical protein